jgi:hypothetical protein
VSIEAPNRQAVKSSPDSVSGATTTAPELSLTQGTMLSLSNNAHYAPVRRALSEHRHEGRSGGLDSMSPRKPRKHVAEEAQKTRLSLCFCCVSPLSLSLSVPFSVSFSDFLCLYLHLCICAACICICAGVSESGLSSLSEREDSQRKSLRERRLSEREDSQRERVSQRESLGERRRTSRT